MWVLHLFSYNKKKHLWACIKPITNIEIKVCWVVAYPKLCVVIDTYFMQLVCNFWQIECEIFLHQNLEIPFIYVTRLSYSMILCHLCKNMVVIWCNKDSCLRLVNLFYIYLETIICFHFHSLSFCWRKEGMWLHLQQTGKTISTMQYHILLRSNETLKELLNELPP